jgi:hypothetical protein
MHLDRKHGFTFEEVGVPAESNLRELHDELHDQEDRYALPTHSHRWSVVDIHSGEVSVLFATEGEAQTWVTNEQGQDAGKGFIIRRAIE